MMYDEMQYDPDFLSEFLLVFMFGWIPHLFECVRCGSKYSVIAPERYEFLLCECGAKLEKQN